MSTKVAVVGDSRASVVDLELGKVVAGDLVNVMSCAVIH
jgi:hypothetical protein